MKLNQREMILALLADFVKQRPGLEFGNYGDVALYRSEMRSITRDRHDAEKLLAQVAWRESIGEPELREAIRAYSGRLQLEDRPDGKMALHYCTGQYFPTEYRKAVCAVLSSALWAYARENLNTKTDRPGDELRAHFRREFGSRLANRWFN